MHGVWGSTGYTWYPLGGSRLYIVSENSETPSKPVLRTSEYFPDFCHLAWFISRKNILGDFDSTLSASEFDSKLFESAEMRPLRQVLYVNNFLLSCARATVVRTADESVYQEECRKRWSLRWWIWWHWMMCYLGGGDLCPLFLDLVTLSTRSSAFGGSWIMPMVPVYDHCSGSWHGTTDFCWTTPRTKDQQPIINAGRKTIPTLQQHPALLFSNCRLSGARVPRWQRHVTALSYFEKRTKQ